MQSNSANSFYPLSNQRLPVPYRILPTSCSPDKDLVVLISRLGGKDRLSLWKVQGGRSWEVDVSMMKEGGEGEEVVGLCWSPSGNSITVAHHPPRVSLHNVQDGKLQREIHLDLPPPPPNSEPVKIRDLWWFAQGKPADTAQIPDIFKRNGIIPGSVHSILRMLPLLDAIQEDTQTTQTPLFSHTPAPKSTPTSSLPGYITTWPSLPPNPLLASIIPSPGKLPDEPEEIDDTNLNSLLIICDSTGTLHFYLEGSYPLGSVRLGGGMIESLEKTPMKPVLYAFEYSALRPTAITFPALQTRKVRDVAQLTSTAKELCAYTVKCVDAMRRAWVGAGEARGKGMGKTGAGERDGVSGMGGRWVESMRGVLRKHGDADPNPVLELTILLLTGRPSEGLHDFLGSAESVTERGIVKWETTVIESLVRIRDIAEKLLAPACQRLHLVLEEMSGLAQINQYALFSLKDQRDEIANIAQMLVRAITICAWLASACRKEMLRFTQFMLWLKFEITSNLASEPPTPPTSPRHDILEVNEYLVKGLVGSNVDKFFEGPIPTFSLSDLGIANANAERTLDKAIEEAMRVVRDRGAMEWQMSAHFTDLSRLDRNIHALIDQIGSSLGDVVRGTVGAAAHTAEVVRPHGLVGGPSHPGSAVGGAPATDLSTDSNAAPLKFSERVVRAENETTTFTQYLAVVAPSRESVVCFLRIRFQSNEEHPVNPPPPGEASEPTLPPEPPTTNPDPIITTNTNDSVEIAELGVVLVDFHHPPLPEASVKILTTEFFDDERVVLVYQVQSDAFIGMVPYHDLQYQDIASSVDLAAIRTREQLVYMCTNGDIDAEGLQFRAESMAIKRCRALATGDDGVGGLAVNGKAGRTVACVLDGRGTVLETMDMESDPDGGDESVYMDDSINQSLQEE